MATTKNIVDVIRKKLKADPELAEAVEQARFNANIADAIFNARCQANMTQAELAALCGMKQSAIARMEDANYGRHSIRSLKRIATALHKRLEITFADTYTSMEWPSIHCIDIQIENPSAWSKPSSDWNGLSPQLSQSFSDQIQKIRLEMTCAI